MANIMAKTFSLRQRLLLAVAGHLGVWVLLLLGLTWRIKVRGRLDIYPQRKKTAKRIYCFWHNRQLGLAYTERKKNVGILISSHFDGELIARIVSRLGYLPLRGSSTKGGSAGLISMIKNEEVTYLAITVDGPRGPKGIVKPGALYLASRSGLPIVPVSCDSSSKWVMNSWDRFEIPRPFAQVVVSIGEPIFIDNNADNRELDKQTGKLAAILDELGKCSFSIK